MASFPILVNSVVHIVMYAYYQITSMGPKYQKVAIKYKKYVTIIQLVILCKSIVIVCNILLISISFADSIYYPSNTHTTSCIIKLSYAWFVLIWNAARHKCIVLFIL